MPRKDSKQNGEGSELARCPFLVQCEECGRYLTELPSHLSAKHGLTVDEYRARHGDGSPVMAEGTGNEDGYGPFLE